MRKRLVLAVLAMSLLIASPATAQTEMDQAQAAVTAATDRLEALLEQLESTQRRGNELAGQFWQEQSELEKLDRELMVTEQATSELADQVEALRDQVRMIALDRYVNRSEPVSEVDHQSEADRAAAEALARIVAGSDADAINDFAVIDAEYDQLRSQLQSQRADQQHAIALVDQMQSDIAHDLDRLATLRASLDSELVRLEQALDALEQDEADRLAEEERQLLAEQRRRAQEAAAAAAAKVQQVPNPQLPVPEPTVPNPQLPVAYSAESTVAGCVAGS